MLKLKLRYFGHLIRILSWLTGKNPDAGKTEGRRRRGQQRIRWLDWHHWFNGHELGQTPGDFEGQGSLVCCSPWGCEESDMTWQLNNSSNKGSRTRNCSIVFTGHDAPLILSSLQSNCKNHLYNSIKNQKYLVINQRYTKSLQKSLKL